MDTAPFYTTFNRIINFAKTDKASQNDVNKSRDTRGWARVQNRKNACEPLGLT